MRGDFHACQRSSKARVISDVLKHAELFLVGRTGRAQVHEDRRAVRCPFPERQCSLQNSHQEKR